MDSPPCELLPWDTEFFGFRIARVKIPAATQMEMDRVEHWCDDEGIRCLYFLVPAQHQSTSDLIAQRGFRLVDIRITLECRDVKPEQAPEEIRPATESDIPVLAGIARVSHTDSRFYADRHFPAQRCDDLYATWIEKSCRGYADGVLVAEKDGRPAGYITCNWREAAGQIGLLAVADWARGTGLGHRLIHASLGMMGQHGMTRATVVTQGRNVQAQRLYQQCGFRTFSVGLWYHRWF